MDDPSQQKDSTVQGHGAEALRSEQAASDTTLDFLEWSESWASSHGKTFPMILECLKKADSDLLVWMQRCPRHFDGSLGLPNFAAQWMSVAARKLNQSLMAVALHGDATAVACLVHQAIDLTRTLGEIVKHCEEFPGERGPALDALRSIASEQTFWPILGTANESYHRQALAHAVSLLKLGSKRPHFRTSGRGNRGSPNAPLPALIRDLWEEIDQMWTQYRDFQPLLQPTATTDTLHRFVDSFRTPETFVQYHLKHESAHVKEVLIRAISLPEFSRATLKAWSDALWELVLAREAFEPFEAVRVAARQYIEKTMRERRAKESPATYESAREQQVLSKFKALARAEIGKILNRFVAENGAT